MLPHHRGYLVAAPIAATCIAFLARRFLSRSSAKRSPSSSSPSVKKRDIGILLVNLGTPESPRPRDVFHYLIEFLTDGRVIDIPWFARQMLVRCIIAPFRHRSSAANYEMIWHRDNMHTSDGSPLMYHSKRMREMLQRALNNDDDDDERVIQRQQQQQKKKNTTTATTGATAMYPHLVDSDSISSGGGGGGGEMEDDSGPFVVELGMNYGTPTIRDALERLHHDHHVKQIVVVPFFPQYASATVGSIHDKVMRIVSKWQTIPNMSFVSSYAMHKDYIDSVVHHALSQQCMKHRDHDHYLFSFHGLPKRQLRKGDITRRKQCCLVENECKSDQQELSSTPPQANDIMQCCQSAENRNAKWFCYRSQCIKSTAIVAHRLGIPPDQYTVCFQSRLGQEEWTKPYLMDTVRNLVANGKKRLCVFSLSFTNDCVETLHELEIELEEDFKLMGGERLDVIKSLNEFPEWVQALKNIILEFTNSNLISNPENSTWHH